MSDLTDCISVTSMRKANRKWINKRPTVWPLRLWLFSASPEIQRQPGAQTAAVHGDAGDGAHSAVGIQLQIFFPGEVTFPQRQLRLPAARKGWSLQGCFCLKTDKQAPSTRQKCMKDVNVPASHATGRARQSLQSQITTSKNIKMSRVPFCCAHAYRLAKLQGIRWFDKPEERQEKKNLFRDISVFLLPKPHVLSCLKGTHCKVSSSV